MDQYQPNTFCTMIYYEIVDSVTLLWDYIEWVLIPNHCDGIESYICDNA